MDVKNTHSDVFNELMQKFEEALKMRDKIALKVYSEKLKKMVHPRSYIRKILDIKMAGVGCSE